MLDTTLATKIRKLTDSELKRQVSSAYDIAYYESYGSDYEGRADAIRRYEMLAREQKRRRAASEKTP